MQWSQSRRKRRVGRSIFYHHKTYPSYSYMLKTKIRRGCIIMHEISQSVCIECQERSNVGLAYTCVSISNSVSNLLSLCSVFSKSNRSCLLSICSVETWGVQKFERELFSHRRSCLIMYMKAYPQESTEYLSIIIHSQIYNCYILIQAKVIIHTTQKEHLCNLLLVFTCIMLFLIV